MAHGLTSTRLWFTLLPVVWSLSLGLARVGGAEVQASSNGSTWQWTPDEWTYTATYTEIGKYANRPSAPALQAITVEWQQPALDALGNFCSLRGCLRIPDEKRETTRPVDWFQGVTVYMGKVPGAKPDWSRGMSQETALSETTVVSPSGEFEVRIDRRKSQHDRSRQQPFQFGVALAEHTELGNGHHRVVWNSRTPAIPSTVQMRGVPAAAKLSRELELINQANGWPFSDHNGVALIRAINALQPLGKERALETLQEYVRLIDTIEYRNAREIVFWIIRVLFEPIRLNDRIPSPGIAVFLVDERSAAAANWPLNPLAIVDDVPFMLGQQCAMGGRPEHPSAHIEWARRHGVVRDEPLWPGNPLAAARALLGSQRFQQLDEVSRTLATQLVRSQALAMVNKVLPTTSTEGLDDAEEERRWKAVVKQAIRHEIRWDAKRQEFVGKGK